MSVDDIIEKGVTPIEDLIAECQKQYLLRVVNNYRKKYPDYKKEKDPFIVINFVVLLIFKNTFHKICFKSVSNCFLLIKVYYLYFMLFKLPKIIESFLFFTF